MHTNETANLRLSQFVGTDIPNPLTDYNGDMQKIDDAVGALQSTEGQYATDITEIKAQNGSETLTTDAQTLSGGVNENKASIDAVEARTTILEGKVVADESTLATAVNNVSTLAGKVSALETQNGSEVLHTTAQTLSGAINEVADEIAGSAGSLDSRISALETQNGNEVLQTTAQTLSGAINELYNAPASSVDAEDVGYDNTTSGLTGTDVQAAIDEVNQKVEDIPAVSVEVEVQRGTLTAGQTSLVLTFTEQTIGANTLVDIYTPFGINPTNATTTSNTVTLTFDAQASNINVGVQVKN